MGLDGLQADGAVVVVVPMMDFIAQQPNVDPLPHERHQERTMTPEEYLGRVRATVWHAADYLPAQRLEEVHRLIDHGEPAEGLCSLAWVIVSERIQLPVSIVDAIYEYSAGLIDNEFMPQDLEDFAQPEGGQV
jgi:hypothetical protein